MKSIKKVNSQLRTRWRNLMDSKCLHMSRGAQKISTMISRASGDNWRRGRERKKQSKK